MLFDWARRETFGEALERVNSVYLITPALVEEPAAMIEPFLEEAARAGVGRMVLLSSLGVEFPNEDGTSGRHKVERLLQRSGISWTILRPGGFMQNFSESFALPMIMQADTIALATGEGDVAYVDADDIAAIAKAALLEERHHNSTYVVTGSEALTGADIARIISRYAGRHIGFRALQSTEFSQMLASAGVPAAYAAAMVRNQDAIAKGWGNRISTDVQRVTGHGPARFEDYAASAAPIWRK
jgi:uncharacterized protein YbjT (DUF2867 family)